MPGRTTALAETTHHAAIHEIERGIIELSPELFCRAMRMTGSPAGAEDLVQDTIERAIKFHSRYQPGTNFRAWIHQILFSVFITRCRRGQREHRAIGALTADPCAWTIPEETRADMNELSPSMARALKKLPKPFRSVIQLVILQELSYKDAARQLRIPVGTVMSRLHRGRRMLAESVRAKEMECAAAQAA